MTSVSLLSRASDNAYATAWFADVEPSTGIAFCTVQGE
jgi:hypothetical protein